MLKKQTEVSDKILYKGQKVDLSPNLMALGHSISNGSELTNRFEVTDYRDAIKNAITASLSHRMSNKTETMLIRTLGVIISSM
jgi:hypothetical protein